MERGQHHRQRRRLQHVMEGSKQPTRPWMTATGLGEYCLGPKCCNHLLTHLVREAPLRDDVLFYELPARITHRSGE